MSGKETKAILPTPFSSSPDFTLSRSGAHTQPTSIISSNSVKGDQFKGDLMRRLFSRGSSLSYIKDCGVHFEQGGRESDTPAAENAIPPHLHLLQPFLFILPCSSLFLNATLAVEC